MYRSLFPRDLFAEFDRLQREMQQVMDPTPGIRGKLKKTKTDSGSGIFVWPTGARELNGYNVGVTTQVPSTLTKGSSSGVCHALLFGNFADLIIAIRRNVLGQIAGSDLLGHTQCFG